MKKQYIVAFGLVLLGLGSWVVAQEFSGEDGPNHYMVVTMRDAQRELEDMKHLLKSRTLAPHEALMALREIASRNKKGVRTASQAKANLSINEESVIVLPR